MAGGTAAELWRAVGCGTEDFDHSGEVRM